MDMQEAKHRVATQQETRTLTGKSDQEGPAQESFSQRKRPENGQFRLQVDRQTKGSYATSEAAEAAGLAIKNSHPIVQVTVYDIVASTNKTIDLP
jgi:hypothetical protein